MIAALALTSLVAMGAMAAPTEKRQNPTFNINVVNNCGNDLNLGTFNINYQTYVASQVGSTQTAPANGGTTTFTVDQTLTGMRLSTEDVNSQFNAQSLFEFGYGSAEGQTGTAYDLSLMGKSTPTMQVVPSDGSCETKICNAANGYPEDQCWTDPSQSNDGSPADTGCYNNGQTDFTVTYCV